ncbi:hypothetical protein D3C80_276060 [compost metagenome]
MTHSFLACYHDYYMTERAFHPGSVNTESTLNDPYSAIAHVDADPDQKISLLPVLFNHSEKIHSRCFTSLPFPCGRTLSPNQEITKKSHDTEYL